jgi:hypothetical protein
MITPTPEQIENRYKLINYLNSGNLKADFAMNLFSVNEDFQDEDCGSIGCAIGHGPYANIPKIKRENWHVYSERVFGILLENIQWVYCFSAFWDDFDNTAKGAANRLLFLTENNPTNIELLKMIPFDVSDDYDAEGEYLFKNFTEEHENELPF